MLHQIVNRQPPRVLGVVAGSAAAFIGLAVVIYWLYFTNRGTVYDPYLDEGLATLRALFYVAFVVHMGMSIAAAVALTLWSKAPMYPTFAAVAVTFAILTVPLLFLLTGFHQCATGESFPIPGFPNNCD